MDQLKSHGSCSFNMRSFLNTQLFDVLCWPVFLLSLYLTFALYFLIFERKQLPNYSEPRHGAAAVFCAAASVSWTRFYSFCFHRGFRGTHCDNHSGGKRGLCCFLGDH